MAASTNLQLPFLAQAQAQKHVTLNTALLLLDALVQLSVVSATTSAQPGSPSDGQVYILPAGKSGVDWSDMSNGALAYYRDGVWDEIDPRTGWIAITADSGELLHYTGSAWTLFAPAKVITVSATDKVLGRVSSGAGAAEEIAFTDQAQQLCDDASFADMRTTLGAAGTGANTFTAAQIISGSGTGDLLTLESTNAGAGAAPGLNLDRNSASPAASDALGYLRFSGRESGGASKIYAQIRGLIADPTNATEDGTLSFGTMVAGAFAENWLLGAGFYASGATGGDKGAGTLNAKAVYDDNTLLTCGPIEFMRDGVVNLEKWDALDSKQHRHAAMHHFAAMLADGFDPRDPENFCARMRTDSAVPGLFTEREWREMAERGEKPDIGASLTRTFLALDNLAVAFASVVARVSALEARA